MRSGPPPAIRLGNHFIPSCLEAGLETMTECVVSALPCDEFVHASGTHVSICAAFAFASFCLACGLPLK